MSFGSLAGQATGDGWGHACMDGVLNFEGWGLVTNSAQLASLHDRFLPGWASLQEGMIALWRGWLPSVIGVIPYVGLNFSVYETLKDMTLKHYGELFPSLLLLPPPILKVCSLREACQAVNGSRLTLCMNH